MYGSKTAGTFRPVLENLQCFDVTSPSFWIKHDMHIAGEIKHRTLILLTGIGAVPGHNQVTSILDGHNSRIGGIVIGFIRQGIQPI